jgi:hypothetical protein
VPQFQLFGLRCRPFSFLAFSGLCLLQRRLSIEEMVDGPCQFSRRDDHALCKGKSNQPIPGAGIHQPMLWMVNYGNGRVFVTALGHDPAAMNSAGFTATLVRGAERAAAGNATIRRRQRSRNSGLTWKDAQFRRPPALRLRLGQWVRSAIPAKWGHRRHPP